MDVNASSIYQEMQSMIGQVQGPSAQEMTPNEINPSSSDFGAMLKQAVDGVNSMQLESKDAQQRFEMGDKSLSLAQVMIAKEKSGIAFEATMQVRNKVLEAYKQIMNMPV
jgi:flagellar hook-basal body complex protein FliE